MYSRIKQLNRFTDMIQIRPSQLSDLDRLMEIFDHARKFMASVGNGNQWINGYPQRELIAKEITDGHCYACEDEHGKIVGTFCFVPSPDPFYSIIEDIANAFVTSVGSDTVNHIIGIIMQKLLTRNGFIRCGIVHVSNGTARIAYQKII